MVIIWQIYASRFIYDYQREIKALFGVSILKTRATRAMSCGMSCIECQCEMCDLQIFYFFVRVYFDEEKPAFDRFSLYFLLDK